MGRITASNWQKPLAVALAALSPLLFSLPAYAWSTPLKISGTLTSSHVPAMALGNDNVIHAVWANDEASGDREIYYVRSTDGGVSFSAPVNLSGTASYTSAEPVVFIASDQSAQVHVVWEEYGLTEDPNGAEVRYTRSTDGGVSWPVANKRNVSGTAGFSGSPYGFVDDAAAGQRVHVGWTECSDSSDNCEIYYAKSTDGGAAFGAAVNVSNNAVDNDQVSIAANATAIQLVWQSDLLVHSSRSTNGGATFSAPTRRSSSASGIEIEPTVIVDGSDRVHIAWEGHNDVGGADIFWTRSTDHGATFQAPANRSNNASSYSQGPFLGTPKDNRVTLVWMENLQDGNQSYDTKSANGGNTWSVPNVLSPNKSFNAQEPALVLKGNASYSVWEDNSEIYFSKE